MRSQKTNPVSGLYERMRLSSITAYEHAQKGSHSQFSRYLGTDQKDRSLPERDFRLNKLINSD